MTLILRLLPILCAAMRCPNCDGAGLAWVLVTCPLCGDEILEDELVMSNGTPCHIGCIEEKDNG